MRSIAALIAVAALLGGCQTPCPVTNTAPVSVSYQCEDGSHLNATYFRSPDRVRVEQEGYPPLDLPSRVSGSGYRYSDEGAELRGRTSAIRWARPGAAPTTCSEIAPATTGGVAGQPVAQRPSTILSCRG